MSIRVVKKSRSSDSTSGPDANASTTNQIDLEDPLLFWSGHAIRARLVDLRCFATGQDIVGKRHWGGPFSGRPDLIAQLAPAIRECVMTSAPGTIQAFIGSLRNIWRLFDQIEVSAAKPIGSLVRTLDDISDVTKQAAIDAGLTVAAVRPFARVVDLTRQALGMRRLYWTISATEATNRQLPDFSQIRPIRDALKRRWYTALDRWERVDLLLAGGSPDSERERLLLLNCRRLRETAELTGKAWPTSVDLLQGRSATLFYRQGYRLEVMAKSMFVDADDIRTAFHLCLATTGWNPSTLLDIDVSRPFIEPHPKDPTRYILTAYKERAKAYQITEGLFKCQRSAGVILKTLVERTAPLRAQLRVQHAEVSHELQTLEAGGARRAALDAVRTKLVNLEAGIRSPWLFVATQGITWLDGAGYQRIGKASYLEALVDEINVGRSTERHVPLIKASDFRDAFATYAYQQSGGMVLYVMRALGHRNVTTTQRYLDNTVLNSARNKIYRTFSNRLWSEIKVSGRLDPTVIAKWCRDGDVSEEDRARLHEYRDLRRSRLGIGCKAPFAPPAVVGGRSGRSGKPLMCSTHRCTLCIENAVILPESLPGLAMRLAELQHLRTNMPLTAFTFSSFDEELTNTEFALQGFDPTEASKHVADWKARIADGSHRPVHLTYEQGGFP